MWTNSSASLPKTTGPHASSSLFQISRWGSVLSVLMKSLRIQIQHVHKDWMGKGSPFLGCERSRVKNTERVELYVSASSVYWGALQCSWGGGRCLVSFSGEEMKAQVAPYSLRQNFHLTHFTWSTFTLSARNLKGGILRLIFRNILVFLLKHFHTLYCNKKHILFLQLSIWIYYSIPPPCGVGGETQD